MPPVADAVADLPSLAGDPGFAHLEDLGRWFERVARDAAAGPALRRLALHLDADLDAAACLALWRALWSCWRRASPAERRCAAAALDGRHAASLAALQHGWSDPLLLLQACDQRGSAADDGFVPLLLAHHGLDTWSDPAAQPGLTLHAARAAVQSGARLAADRIGTVQAAVLAAVERDPAQLPPALSLLFELALHARDEAGATAVLAESLQQGHAGALRADRVRAWLDGSAFADGEATAPLLLAAPLQRQWLQLPRWRQRRWLAAVHRALQRDAPRERLRQLAAALAPGDDDGLEPAADALQALQRLDRAWARAAAGEDPLPPLAGRLHKGVIAPPALAAVQRARAAVAAARGDLETQVLALTQARRHRATPDLQAELAALLPAPVPALDADGAAEQPYWQALLQHADAMWQRLARRQLITLWTDGQLQPRAAVRCAQRPVDVQRLWTELAEHPLHAAAARAALAQPELALAAAAFQVAGDDGCLWFDTPGASQVMVVFSCVASHHGFAEVGLLHGRLPDHHLLFVRCPEKNWYSDAAFDRLRSLLQQRVATRFAREAVSCWYGSMGGHGAWKLALEFGWRALVFNPQTDLDLWAAFRPRERALLWGAQRHAQLLQAPLAAFERTPLYLACGAATPDRVALSLAIGRLRRCRRLDAIVEKFDDDNHAGLMHRIAGGTVPAALTRIDRRLRQLAGCGPGEGPGLPPEAGAGFWDALDDARSAKVEVRVRDGRLWWQPSLASGTR